MPIFQSMQCFFHLPLISQAFVPLSDSLSSRMASENALSTHSSAMEVRGFYKFLRSFRSSKIVSRGWLGVNSMTSKGWRQVMKTFWRPRIQWMWLLNNPGKWERCSGPGKNLQWEPEQYCVQMVHARESRCAVHSNKLQHAAQRLTAHISHVNLKCSDGCCGVSDGSKVSWTGPYQGSRRVWV